MTYKKNSNVDNELNYELNENDNSSDKHKLSKHHQQPVAWRRNMVLMAMVHGTTSTYELSRILKVSQSTCYRDVQYLKQQAADELRTHITQRVPWQYKVSTEGISEVLKFAWSLVLQQQKDGRTHSGTTATLSLISQCYKDLLEMSTNATVVTDALQQVEKMKDQIASNTSNAESSHSKK